MNNQLLEIEPKELKFSCEQLSVVIILCLFAFAYQIRKTFFNKYLLLFKYTISLKILG